MLNRPVLPFRLAALPLLLCVFACGGREESGPAAGSDASAPPAASTAQAPMNAVTFEPRSIEKKDDPSSVSFTYPVITAAPSEALKTALTQAINEFLSAAPAGEDQKSSTPEAAVDAFLADARSTRAENPDGALPWSLSRTAELYQDSKVVSLHLSEDVFQGGAHGLTTVHLASFDPATGRRLGLSDLVTPEGEARLVEIGERELRKVHEVPPKQSLEEAGFTFEGGKFVLSEEIAVLADGLNFYYNPYEIGPYAMGPTQIVIPRSELAPIAKPGGPLN
jgi:Protein of unknown function (DUF3298)/Deacetylase PdaC